MRARAVLRYLKWAEVLCELEPSEETAGVMMAIAGVEAARALMHAVGLRTR